MSEFIVSVPDEAAEYFIARFGMDGTKMMGYDLTGEIVRCRDCAYMREQTWNAITATGLWCVEHDIPVNADGFCAWAERKEGGDA